MKFHKCLICLFALFVTIDSFAQPKLIGAMQYSGPQFGGAIFRADMPGTTPGIIHSFNNLAPHRPVGGVAAGDGNWLYGNLTYNGTNDRGAFYKIQRDGTSFTKLYDYTNTYGANMIPYFHTDDMIYFCDGSIIKKYDPANGTFTDLNISQFSPTRNLMIDADDWMYLIEGTFFSQLIRMKTDGTQEEVLHTFDDATEGTFGQAGLTEVPGDTLFGVMTFTGTSDGGTLYSIKKDGTGFFIHHQFANATGKWPQSKLKLFDGKLFGITSGGGDFDHGVLFSVSADGSNYRVLHHFDGGVSGVGYVAFNISISSNGRIFGSFSQYSDNPGAKRLFKIDTSGANFEAFFDVNQYEQGNANQDILLIDDETIFLTTSEMGRNDGGTLNQCDTSGIGSSLYQFGYSANGFRPLHGLIKASDGKLYGTTSIGGLAGNGIVFSMNADGTNYTKLHEFTDNEGYEPSGKLLEASDGKLYGACKYGGAFGVGCLYRMNKNGTAFDTLYSFYTFEGYSPVGGLIEDNTGALYGTTFYGMGSGSIFKINKNGTNYTTLKVFSNSPDLAYPYNGLTRAGNYLYGTCGYGGAENKGGVFRIRTNGTGYQVLHEFATATVGELPVATPLIASDGKLYGTTAFGGIGDGIVYRIDTTGTNYTLLHTFNYTVDGSSPWGGIIQASDGLLYGTTINSGISSTPYLGGGTLYKLNLDGSGFTLLKEFNFQTEGQGSTSLIDLSLIPLPVQWLTFTAQKKQQTVLLNWQTAQEQNSDRFEIERSANGISFNKIGSVTAAGNTTNVSDYSFTDYHPLNGTNFYRLKQIDIDGKFTYSRTVSVDFGDIARISVFPNPASDHLNVRWGNDSYTTIEVLDASGKLMLQKGILPSATGIDVDTHRLIKGWYVIRLTGKKTEQSSFIKE
jgi:uncharacterized repeat protein (TIGR03803 family)